MRICDKRVEYAKLVLRWDSNKKEKTTEAYRLDLNLTRHLFENRDKTCRYEIAGDNPNLSPHQLVLVSLIY